MRNRFILRNRSSFPIWLRPIGRAVVDSSIPPEFTPFLLSVVHFALIDAIPPVLTVVLHARPVTIFLKLQVICVTDVASRKRLRSGKIGLLGNLEKVPDATGFGVTKLNCELAVPGLRRSLGVREPVSAEVRRECTRGASDVAKSTVGCPDGPRDGAGGCRAPGTGSKLCWWCLVAYLPSAPGVLRARSVSTPASNVSQERSR